MKITKKLLGELQRRLKIGNRKGVHLNAIPANSRYKFDLNRLAHINENLPSDFITALLSEQPLKFRISWMDNVPDLNSLFEEEQTQLVRITKAFENLINQTEAIEAEKGINTFGFGFPILARRDRADNKLTVSPVLIWSLRIKRTKDFNTWEILRNEDDPIYINEVLINHLQNDSSVEIEQIPGEMLDDGLIQKDELIEICTKLLKKINTTASEDLEENLRLKLNKVVSIGDKAHYEKLPLNSTNSLIDFGGLFSIFEVQKQNIINDYNNLLDLQGTEIILDDLEVHSFQPISSVETDPSQQSVLHSLGTTRNILIQGPPGTGKSQTLTAVLINALENKKKTIVVCEKRTALEVLYNSLIEKGLHYHCILIRDIVKDRKTVVNSVRDRIDNTGYRRYSYNYSKESLDNIIQKAKGLIQIINNKHQKLDQKILGTKSWTDVVGDLLRELRDKDYDNNINLEKLNIQFSTTELNHLLELAQKSHSLYKDYLPIEPKSFLNPKKLVGDNPFVIEKQINNDFDSYLKLLEQIQQLSISFMEEYTSSRKEELKKQISTIENIIEQILNKELTFNTLIHNAQERYYRFRRTELEQQLQSFNYIVSQIDDILISNGNNSELTDDIRINGFAYKVLSIFSAAKKKTRANHFALQKCYLDIENYLKTASEIPSINFLGTLDDKNLTLQDLKKAINNIKKTFEVKIEAEFSALDLNQISNVKTNPFQKIEQAAETADVQMRTVLEFIKNDLSQYLSEIQLLFQLLGEELSKTTDFRMKVSFDKSVLESKDQLLEIRSKIEIVKNGFEKIVAHELVKINLLKPSKLGLSSLQELQATVKFLKEQIRFDDWIRISFKGDNFAEFIKCVKNAIDIKKNFFSDEHDNFLPEFKWFQFYNSLSETERELVEQLKPKRNWKKVLLTNYLSSLLVSSANMQLPTSDEEHNALHETLTGLGKEQLKFVQEFWYSKQIDTARAFEENNVGLSVENLYNKRSSKSYKRLSLRQIVQKDADLFSDFFPIILTSPDVASNLFKGMNGYFDIVMFDEASQLRLEDNLPAILKGKQIIIAGDEHQMPPSNYFSKVFDGAIEDEDDLDEEDNDQIKIDKDEILLSCESLLDFGTELNFQKEYLDFHYRSRHPFLIDFSNYAFYNQRLKPLPNHFEYNPITYIQVNGTFSDHTNEAEAESVLSIIDKNIHRFPNGEFPTVGIATFNIAQRNLIKSKILERQKFSKYAEFNAKIQELEENGMFVKNLENIQGDERDVIILSTTYGLSKDGKFSQRFGPINHSKGYKLLNVIITRAKYKVYCCSSIPEEVFMNYKEYLITEGSNNKRAVFFAYLAYCKAVSASDSDSRLSILTSLAENTSNSAGINPIRFGELESPFEEEVYQTLVEHFGTEKLIPQLQFAGFRIDIVFDPIVIGLPRIAIECDGAKYHSSREAYLYDRHRQKILEGHGFVFHRIWSTNWWRNPQRATAKLVEFIKQVEATPRRNEIVYSHTAHAFTDDVETTGGDNAHNSPRNLKKENEAIQAIARVTPGQTTMFMGDGIRLNSKVQVKYMNNGKYIDVQLVSTENNSSTRQSLQKIYVKSPLAISLLGHVVGDIVKIGSLDNFVEIIKVTN